MSANEAQPNRHQMSHNMLAAKGYLVDKNRFLEDELLKLKQELFDLHRKYEQALITVGEKSDAEMQLKEDLEDLKRTLRMQALMITRDMGMLLDQGVETK
jgi:hypothetical protein